MKRIRLILILIISLFLIGGCDETIDCGKNPDHESCIENIDCVKDPDHESCIDEVNYKEIELDASVLTKTLPEPSWWSPKSNFVGILQKYMTEKMSIPLLKFSEIDEFYIGLYIDKTFMETVRWELSEERKNSFSAKDENTNWNLHWALRESYDLYARYQNNVLNYKLLEVYLSIIEKEISCYDINGNKIDSSSYPLKFYKVDKNKDIKVEFDNLELIALYGTRTVEVVDDLYVKEMIGEKEVVYFWVPGIIEKGFVTALEKDDSYYGYNYNLRIKSSQITYIYTSTEYNFKNGLYISSVLGRNLGMIVESEGVKYLVLPEFGVENKDGEASISNTEKELLKLLIKDFSKQATLELYYEKYLDEDLSPEEIDALLDKYIFEKGYIYEVYKYLDIIK